MTSIVLDFDGTVADHCYPRIGQEVPGSVTCLRYWNHLGLRIILSTMRSGKELDDAVKWFIARDVTLYAVQQDPNQHEWTSSPKCHGDICVDDRNAGTPLIQYPSFNRPCVLWDDVLHTNSKRVKHYGMRTLVNRILHNNHIIQL